MTLKLWPFFYHDKSYHHSEEDKLVVAVSSFDIRVRRME